MPSGTKVVSVITPFYNTVAYLAECIESVLAQTMEDFEYVLADNASTDGSKEIAEDYARRDSRIRLLHFDELLPQIPNYNRALRQADPTSRYCKVAQADDRLLPDCLAEMVALADSDPEISLVGAYAILQDHVFLDGLDFYECVIPGDELCRRYLDDGPYLFGSPTTHMYRMSDVRACEAFYDERAPFADTDAAVRLVMGRKFGFVHRILSFVRTNRGSISKGLRDYNVDALTRRIVLEKYGRRVLEGEAFRRTRRRLALRHNRILGEAFLLRRPPDFWDLHRRGANDGGFPMRKVSIFVGAVVVSLRWLASPERTLREVWRWLRRRLSGAVA